MCSLIEMHTYILQGLPNPMEEHEQITSISEYILYLIPKFLASAIFKVVGFLLFSDQRAKYPAEPHNFLTS